MMRKKQLRFARMAMSELNIAILHAKMPWMPMWWSAALPGLGHLCKGSYCKGLILMLWEILVNFKARINISILHTFTGEFSKAREALNVEWALVYGVIFCFSIFDSYRNSVESNILSRLERQQKKSDYRFMIMSPYGMNYLNRLNPWLAATWSALLPGFGHMYNGKTIKGTILLVWSVAIIYFSHVNHGIIATFTGEFSKVNDIVNYQWLLFFPSIYLFSIWDSYNDAVETNKLFAEAQKQHLRKTYGKTIKN
ncbi:protoporphyrinogen IX oxidase [Desulfocucumis palustris]|uniref:Protoporphyrinogen IX oxidase n=1 Tax=Desulfocucumis palustris TaxID=1898651 RepID=A0A2L2XCG2_9FIRM|nr:hypothetical protein [Desulfocucumis palustris]GBF34019.1 protoporphyrinogen IX oxidase [Desulfocucumis palustris]